jgi:hypothetical protein
MNNLKFTEEKQLIYQLFKNDFRQFAIDFFQYVSDGGVDLALNEIVKEMEEANNE